MNKTAPVHIQRFCYEDKEDKTYCQLQKEYQSDYTFVWKIKCGCGETRFKVFSDEHPSIFLKCTKCNKDITVYDLSYYPAAVKLKEEFAKKQVSVENIEDFNVYAIYEYSDEFETEDDVDLDPNDITWGTAYIANGDVVNKILDDETA